jgi:TolB protein
MLLLSTLACVLALAAAQRATAESGNGGAVETQRATGVIVFDTSEGGETPRIYVVRPDGSNLHQLAGTGEGAFLPRLSPDGRRVAYVSAATGTEEIYVIGLGGRGKRQVTHGEAFSNFAPSFSPDGSRIAFSRCSHFLGTCDIAVIGVDGQGLHTVAGGHWHHNDPVYSPDGRSIAFGSDQGGFDGVVRIVPAAGGAARPVSPVRLAGGRPDWSSDGRWITYTGNLRHGQTFRSHPDGSHLQVISQVGDELIFAAFSPDGRMLVAENAGAPRRGLMLMNADGSGKRPIPHLPAGAGFPDWGVLR